MVTQIGSLYKTASTASTGKVQNAFDASTDTYLNLFMTQLKNQDPTAPFSTEAMTQQMSMLTSTQQTIQMNKNLESLIAMNSNSQATAITGFINKDIELVSDQFYSKGDGGQFSFNVATPGNAKIEIYDADGAKVFENNDYSNTGKFTYLWDGKSTDGDVSLGAGKYKVKVSLQTSANAAFQEVPVTVKGTVSGVDFTNNGEPSLVIGSGDSKIIVGLDKVGFISGQTGTTTANTNTTNTSGT